MINWKEKLDAFLKLNEQNILTHAGKVSSQLAKKTSYTEYEKFEKQQIAKELIDSEQELKEAILRLTSNKEKNNSY